MFTWREKKPHEIPHHHFVAPHDVAISSDDTIYLTEWITHGRVCRMKVTKSD